jgi:iron complex outermembrane receptor protein
MAEYKFKKLGVVLGVVLSGAAGAAETEDFLELPLEQLAKLRITGASAFAESQLDSSATVSVVAREEWEERGARTVPDAVTHLPGVMLLSPPDGGLLIQVRSYDSTSIRGRATLIDGVPINTFAFGSEVFSNAELQLPVMDKLELIRGPSSILYGSDAFHSALLLSTYNKTTTGLQVTGLAGSRNYQQAAVRGTQALDEDRSVQAAISVSHQGDQGDDYSYPGSANGPGGDASREKSYRSGTGMVRLENHNEKLGYQLEIFTDQTSVNEYPGGGTLFIDVRDHDIADRNSHLWMVKGDLNGKLDNGWDWRWDNYYWQNDYGQNYFLFFNQFSNEDQQIVEHRYGSKLNFKHADIKALNAVTQLSFAVGAERQAIDDHDVSSEIYQLFRPSPPDYAGLSQGINSVSMEGKTQWQKGRYQVIYGGRIDDYSTFGQQTSPRLGAIWMPASDYSFKALYGKAFRAPNANEVRGTNFATGDPDMKPETLDNYELSFAREFQSGIVQLVGFKTRWHDRILSVNQHYSNGGESESRGVELSAKFETGNWKFEASGSRITNHTLESSVVRQCDCEPEMFPEWMVDIGIGYRWQAQRLEVFWANRVHDDVRTGDDTQRNVFTNPADHVTDAGHYFRSDLTLQQEWGTSWLGRVAVRNIFDRDNLWPSVVNANGGVNDIPRQISFEVEYRN